MSRATVLVESGVCTSKENAQSASASQENKTLAAD